MVVAGIPSRKPASIVTSNVAAAAIIKYRSQTLKTIFKRFLAFFGLGAAAGAGSSLVTGEGTLSSIFNGVILVGLGIGLVWLLFKFIKK